MIIPMCKGRYGGSRLFALQLFPAHLRVLSLSINSMTLHPLIVSYVYIYAKIAFAKDLRKYLGPFSNNFENYSKKRR